MRKIGVYLLIFGLGSIVLNFLGMNFKLLFWIDSWGTTTGWIIRIGVALLGLAIMLFSKPETESAA